MGVAGGGLDLTVTEEFADHRQAFAESESPGREGVAEVMDSYILEVRLLPNNLPRRVQVAHSGAGFAQRSTAETGRAPPTAGGTRIGADGARGTDTVGDRPK